MIRATLRLVCGAMGLLAASFTFGDQPPESASHPPLGASQSPETQPPAAPAPMGNTSSEAAHVPPDPPQHLMGDMPYPKMAAMMQMDDRGRTGMALFDQLEWRHTAEGDAAEWDAEGWYGGDNNKVWLRSEGERVAGTTQNARADLLWDHTFARWWSVQAGGRQDFGAGPGRYPRVEVGEIRAAAPEVVLLPDEPYPFTAEDGPEEFPAQRTVLVSGRLLTWYGPSLATARADLLGVIGLA